MPPLVKDRPDGEPKCGVDHANLLHLHGGICTHPVPGVPAVLTVAHPQVSIRPKGYTGGTMEVARSAPLPAECKLMRTVGTKHAYLVCLQVGDEGSALGTDCHPTNPSKHVRLCPLRHPNRKVYLGNPRFWTRRVGASGFRRAGKKTGHADQNKENAVHGNDSPWETVVRTGR